MEERRGGQDREKRRRVHIVGRCVASRRIDDTDNGCREYRECLPPRNKQRDLILEASVERQSCRRHRCIVASSRESLREATFYEYSFQEYAYIRIVIYLICLVASSPRK